MRACVEFLPIVGCGNDVPKPTEAIRCAARARPFGRARCSVTWFLCCEESMGTLLATGFLAQPGVKVPHRHRIATADEELLSVRAGGQVGIIAGHCDKPLEPGEAGKLLATSHLPELDLSIFQTQRQDRLAIPQKRDKANAFGVAFERFQTFAG